MTEQEFLLELAGSVGDDAFLVVLAFKLPTVIVSCVWASVVTFAVWFIARTAFRASTFVSAVTAALGRSPENFYRSDRAEAIRILVEHRDEMKL